MSLQQYALLDSTKTFVVEIETIDSTVFASLAPAKTAFYLPVSMTAQPTITPATQFVSQNGWTINAGVNVTPIWVIGTLSSQQQQVVASQTQWTNTLALNIVTVGNNAINNWVSGGTYSATKDTVLLDVLKVVVAMLEAQYGVNN
jgi:hypothetical protein